MKKNESKCLNKKEMKSLNKKEMKKVFGGATLNAKIEEKAGEVDAL